MQETGFRKTTAFATFMGRDIVEVLDIMPDGMVLCLTEDDRYEFIHMIDIDIDWR